MSGEVPTGESGGSEAASEPSPERDAVHQALAVLLASDGVSAADLASRARAAASSFDEEAAERALDGLVRQGLVRVASRTGGDATYVRTTLGREHADALLHPDSPLVSQLVELERLRTDFVATIAHELKTPLTAIRTCLGLLMEPATLADEAVTRRLLERASASTDGMQRLIEALLDLARFRSGELPLEVQAIDAVAVAQEALALVAAQAELHGQRVHLTLPEGLATGEPLEVWGDRPRLVQALGNILSNAQRFSPDGATIEVAVRTQDDHVSWVVQDSGPGISEEDQQHLFERFFRGRSDVGGSGLGLPIALATAQAHGGSIDVASAPGKGSRFTLTIPVDGLRPQDDAAEGAEEDA